MWFATKTGIPIPKFQYIPGFKHCTALVAIISLIVSLPFPFTYSFFPFSPAGFLNFLLSIVFEIFGDLTILSTNHPGKWINSGGISSTIYSAYAIVIFEHPAISGLKFLAVFLNLKFPFLSAWYHLIIEKSISNGCSNKYSLAPKLLTYFGFNT